MKAYHMGENCVLVDSVDARHIVRFCGIVFRETLIDVRFGKS